MRRPTALLMAAALVGALLSVVPTTLALAAGPMVSVRDLVAQLPVVSEHTTGYDRDLFDYGIDADHDGCNTRKEVLIRDAVHLDKVSSSCAVYGTWTSLYDNQTTSDPYSLEVDHLVPLAEAWYSGAYAWTHDQQIAFGNDVAYEWDLQAVTAALNQDKGASDPAEWMPPANQCTYVAAWVGVKARWKLAIDAREKTALLNWLSSCGALEVEAPGTPDVAALSGTGTGSAPTPVAVPAPTPTPAPPAVPTPSPTPAPPAVQAHPTTLKVTSIKRSGKWLRARATLTDVVTGHGIIGVRLVLERKSSGRWHALTHVSPGAFKVKAPQGTYRVSYRATTDHAASTSKSFKR